MIKSCVQCPYPRAYLGISNGYDRLIDEKCCHCRVWLEDRDRIPKSYETENETDVSDSDD